VILPGNVHAVVIDVIDLGNDLLEVALTDIDPVEGRVYTLDPKAGEVTFGDGNAGTRPPSGRSGIIGAYSYNQGLIFNEFDLVNTNYPLLILVSALLDPKAEDNNINFILAGVSALKFDLTPNYMTVISADIAPVPIPSSLVLVLSALAGLGIACRKT
jgi:hypothetical protein